MLPDPHLQPMLCRSTRRTSGHVSKRRPGKLEPGGTLTPHLPALTPPLLKVKAAPGRGGLLRLPAGAGSPPYAPHLPPSPPSLLACRPVFSSRSRALIGAFDTLHPGHLGAGLVLNKGDNQEAKRGVFLAPAWSPSLLSSSEMGFENKPLVLFSEF